MRHLYEIINHVPPLILQQTVSAAQAYQAMCDLHHDSVLVTDSKSHITGIFTGRELRHMLEEHMALDTTTLADVMTPDPVCMPPEYTAIEALRLMWDYGFDHVPVVAKDRIIGVVSRRDFESDEEDCLYRERDLWEHMR